MTSLRLSRLVVTAVLLTALAACDNPTRPDMPTPTVMFPDAAPLEHRHKMHSMAEAPGGQVRVYAAQSGDETDLMIMRRTKTGWSAPALLPLPKRETNSSPRFFPDGTLYYASDAPHPARPGRKDMNIWRVAFEHDVIGEPEVLSDAVNSGSHEDGFAPLGDGRAVFASTTLGGVGGYDLYLAVADGDDWAVTPFPHNTMMADAQPATTPDGRTIFWYAHMPADNVYGGVDLFMSQRTQSGWGTPVNLGPVINSAGIDYGPGVSANGETLFFSRDGILMEVGLASAVANARFVIADAAS